MDLMSRYKNRHFDLAIVDPPYGIGKTWKKDSKSQFYRHDTGYQNEEAPGKDYFDELFRVAGKIIIFGGNYFTAFLPPRNSWIVWDKMKNERGVGSDCELAWTNFNCPLKRARFAWDGHNVCCQRYGRHPHEKPFLLYQWILKNYAKSGWKILDTHLGSGSLAVACQNFGFDLTACEINRQYYDDAMRRVKDNEAQQFLFQKAEIRECGQLFEEAYG
jgi:site-specific DNA-methyltransferase (adenine-specific)